MSHWQRPQFLDRGEGRRNDPDWVEQCWRDRHARMLRVDPEGRVEVADGQLALAPVKGGYDPYRHHLLGLLGGEPVFAVMVEQASSSLRACLDDLSEVELELGFTAVGLIGWHARSGFCGRCGASSVPMLGGLARTCPACGLDDYPRTDPAVIVAITDPEDRLLLARQPVWAPGRYSVLAGFTEVGESLEQTVFREVEEEVGLPVQDVSYLGSQPWPFPRSLMAAFRAHSEQIALRPADGEIEDARWFSRPSLRQDLEAGTITLPPPASIARRMIEAWLAEELSAFRVGAGSETARN